MFFFFFFLQSTLSNKYSGEDSSLLNVPEKKCKGAIAPTQHLSQSQPLNVLVLSLSQQVLTKCKVYFDQLHLVVTKRQPIFTHEKIIFQGTDCSA